jgi:serine/threonine protein kinase
MTPQTGWEPIPGYRLTRPLGAGGFGEVWEADDPKGQRFALKFLDCRTRSPGLIRTEVRVLQGLAELRHPNIIQLFAVHASSRYLILVMERADGNLADLRQAYQDEAGVNVPLEHALELMEQAADALDFLAALTLPGINDSSPGLQHCDVKPSNLLLVGETLKVADFGLCAATGWGGGRGGWKGTPPYAAPELYGGKGVPGSDQHALAVTYCELCAGSRAFQPRPSPLAPPEGLPVDLAAVRHREVPVVARALHPQPSSRWPSCKAFVEALRKAQNASRQMRRLMQSCRR